MSEIETPSDKTIEERTCIGDELNPHPPTLMNQYYGSGSGGYLSSSGLSKQDQKAKLKKRSKDHFNKELKERKHEMNAGRMSGMRD